MKPSLYQMGRYFSERTNELLEKIKDPPPEEETCIKPKHNNLSELTGRWREDIKTIFEESVNNKINTIVLNDYEYSKEIINEVYDNPLYLTESILPSYKWAIIADNIIYQIVNAPTDTVFILDIPILFDKLMCRNDDEVKASVGKVGFIMILLKNISLTNILPQLIVVTKIIIRNEHDPEYPNISIVGGRPLIYSSEAVIRIDKLFSSNTRDGAMIILKHKDRPCNIVTPITF